MTTEEPTTLAEQLKLDEFIANLCGDLKLLRQGKISVREAHARAELARQILRGVHYVVTAQKYLEAKMLPAPAATTQGRSK